MYVASRLVRLVTIAIVAMVLGVAPAFATDRIVANGTSPAKCAQQAHYATIQSAVDAALAGDHVKVCPGSYPEHVVVEGAAKNKLNIEGMDDLKGHNTTAITFPSTPPGGTPDALVLIRGAQNVELHHFTITGPYADAEGAGCGQPEHDGVRVDGGGSAHIDNNHITMIQDAMAALRGCQDGVAVRVGRNFEKQTGSANIESNIIDNYQKNGPTVDGPGSSATIQKNTIVGDTEDANGINPFSALNGVQVGRGATATVNDNAISNNEWIGATSDQSETASGIIVFQVNGGSQPSHSTVRITGNKLSANDIGLDLGIGTVEAPFGATTGVFVQGNQAPAARTAPNRFDAFYALSDTSNNLLENNQATGSGDFDCRDDSTGSGTAGTANTWKGDRGVTQSPMGICQTH